MHGVQGDPADTVYVPALQLMHAAEEEAPYTAVDVPATQLRHTTADKAPTLVEYVPT